MTNLLLLFALTLTHCPPAGRGAAYTMSFSNGSNGGTAPESKGRPSIKNILGRERVAGISKGRQINVYRLSEFTTDAEAQKNGGKKYFLNHEVLDSRRVDPKKSKALKRAILDAGNYMDADYINKCTFTATLGLEIISKRETVNVLVSYPCKKILFIRKGQEFYRDLKSVGSLDQIAQEFLKDLPKIE